MALDMAKYRKKKSKSWKKKSVRCLETFAKEGVGQADSGLMDQYAVPVIDGKVARPGQLHQVVA
jgi:hypothetical protein